MSDGKQKFSGAHYRKTATEKSQKDAEEVKKTQTVTSFYS